MSKEKRPTLDEDSIVSSNHSRFLVVVDCVLIDEEGGDLKSSCKTMRKKTV